MVERGRDRVRTDTWPHSEAGSRLAGPSLLLQKTRLLQRWLRTLILAEAAQAQLLPWIAVAFGVGIVLYFAADREPVLAIIIPVAVLAGGVAFLARRSRVFSIAIIIAALFAGFAVATVRTAIVRHEVLTRPLYASLAGFVEIREERERTDRFVLRITHMEDGRATARPNTAELARVRLSVKKGTAPPVGSFVELKASLNPPLTELRPGSYDFARDLYFHGIGATGLVRGSIKLARAPDDGGAWLHYAATLNALRDAIDGRIRQSLSGDSRAIASALLTGKRDAISTPVNDAMFISGLGHVLSISGYHMAVVAGIVFFAVRALLALFPALTTAFPIKKVAAAVALAAALFYLLLSGSEVATQRSFLMTAVVLLGVMVDRRAITFRTLAIAVLAVLILAPEAVVHPSFQMSFAATLGLVALVHRGFPSFAGSADSSSAARAALWGGREITALILASLIAGLATTPYAAFHFHRATPYGLISNLLAMPVVSAWVMPAGLLGLVAMPFGFDGVFWHLMDGGIAWMVTVSLWVASLPGSVGRIAAFGTGPLLLATAGILLLGLLKTSLRWSGAVVTGIATVWALGIHQPDILVASDGASIAARAADGRFRIVQTRKDAFIAREWLAADADGRQFGDASVSEGTGCDTSGCAIGLGDNRYVTIAQRPDAFIDDCVRAIVIVTWRQPPPGCGATVIDRNALRGSGSLALWRTGEGLRITAARPPALNRPWAARDDSTPAAPASEPTTTPRPVDATPPESDALGEE